MGAVVRIVVPVRIILRGEDADGLYGGREPLARVQVILGDAIEIRQLRVQRRFVLRDDVGTNSSLEAKDFDGLEGLRVDDLENAAAFP
jgi:hypothetical protein